MLIIYPIISALIFTYLSIFNLRRLYWKEHIFSNLVLSVCWPASVLLFICTSIAGCKSVKIRDDIDLSNSDR